MCDTQVQVISAIYICGISFPFCHKMSKPFKAVHYQKCKIYLAFSTSSSVFKCGLNPIRALGRGKYVCMWWSAEQLLNICVVSSCHSFQHIIIVFSLRSVDGYRWSRQEARGHGRHCQWGWGGQSWLQHSRQLQNLQTGSLQADPASRDAPV